MSEGEAKRSRRANAYAGASSPATDVPSLAATSALVHARRPARIAWPLRATPAELSAALRSDVTREGDKDDKTTDDYVVVEHAEGDRFGLGHLSRMSYKFVFYFNIIF